MEEKEINKKKVTVKDFADSHSGVNPMHDQYSLDTPFGSTAKDQVFKPIWEQESERPDPLDVGKEDKFSGGTKKCPGCGANIIYDIDVGSLICKSCGNVYDPTTMEMNGSLGIENQEQEYGIDDELDYEDQSKKEIVCNSCGSQIVTDGNTAATMCPFCGSPTLVTRRLTRQFRPDAIIPFSVTKEEAMKAYHDHISSVGHVPSSFKTKANVEKITAVYVPFWLISADVKMDIGGWTHTIMDGSAFYDPVKQETTRQHSLDVPVDGTVEFSLANVPFDGSKRISNKLMEACEPFDFTKLVPYNASYLTGFLAEKYDSQPKDMYERIKKRLDNYCHDVAELVQFEDCDAFTYNSSYTWITYKNYRVIYCLLPIWFLNINYNGKNYQFAVNGQSGEVCGTIPTSKAYDLMKSFTDRTGTFSYLANREIRSIVYVAPAMIFGALMGLLRMNIIRDRHLEANIIVGLLVMLVVSYIAMLCLPSVFMSFEKNRTAKMLARDPHSLDKAPDVSFYYDTTRKLKARKILTKGGASGIMMPKNSSPFL
ncbi:MAG: TFIIB-type zinc ribbon-containing protein [Clostridiales bacterium]|nr:TFIIB-type zinc ribbon-containing protein [Clostridiales bacterium]